MYVTDSNDAVLVVRTLWLLLLLLKALLKYHKKKNKQVLVVQHVLILLWKCWIWWWSFWSTWRLQSKTQRQAEYCYEHSQLKSVSSILTLLLTTWYLHVHRLKASTVACWEVASIHSLTSTSAVYPSFSDFKAFTMTSSPVEMHQVLPDEPNTT